MLASALPAGAHVTVSSPDAAPGGYGKLVFRVPNESDTVGTVGLTVQLPTDTPFANVSVKPKPGWRVETTTEKLDRPVEVGDVTLSKAVTEVTWAATGGTDIGPGEFDEFELSVGPIGEDVDQLVMPASQRYADGEVVDWDEPPAQGEEPEQPAPVLELAAAAADEPADRPAEKTSAETTADSGPETTQAASTTEAVESTDASDPLARTLGGAGLALGLLAGVLAFARRRPSR